VLADHASAILAVCFSPDGKQLATGSIDKLIKVYSFNEGNAILAHTLENPADGSLVKSIDQAHTMMSRASHTPPTGVFL